MPLTPARARAHANLRHVFHFFFRQFSSQLLSAQIKKTLTPTMSALSQQHPEGYTATPGHQHPPQPPISVAMGTPDPLLAPPPPISVTMGTPDPLPAPPPPMAPPIDVQHPSLQPRIITVCDAARLLAAAGDQCFKKLPPAQAKEAMEWIKQVWLPWKQYEADYKKAKAAGAKGLKPLVPPDVFNMPPCLLGWCKEAAYKGIQSRVTASFNNAKKRLKKADGFKLYPLEEARDILKSNIVEDTTKQVQANIRAVKAEMQELEQGMRDAALAVATAEHQIRMRDADKKIAEAAAAAKRLIEDARKEADQDKQKSKDMLKRSRADANNRYANAVKNSLVVRAAVKEGKEKIKSAKTQKQDAEYSKLQAMCKLIAGKRKVPELSPETVESGDEDSINDE